MTEKPKYRQIRGQITGDADDINHFWMAIREFAIDERWALTWEEHKPFGDLGPLHKLTWGFTSTDATDL